MTFLRLFRPLLVASLTFGLLTASGCSFLDSGSEDAAPQGETVVYQGTLQSLGGVRLEESKATHLFKRDDDSTVLYAYSTTYNLNDADYSNQLLEVSGIVTRAESEKAKDLLFIERLTVVPQEEVSIAPVTRDTYVNEKLGFAMMVRSDWTVEENTTVPLSVTFRSPFKQVSDPTLPQLDPLTSTDTITIFASQGNPEGMSIEEWVRFYGFEGAGQIPVPYVRQVIGPDQFPAIRTSAEGLTTYYIEAGDKVFTLEHVDIAGDGNDLEYSTLFADMLYSFDPLADGQRAAAVAIEVTPPTVETVSEEVEATPPAPEATPDVPQTGIIPPQFAVLESSTLHLRMGYPKLWYWSRSGLSILFTETEDAETAVVTLEILDGTVKSYDNGVSGDIVWAKVPRDEFTYYHVNGGKAFEEDIHAMAKTIQRFELPAAE